MSTLAIWCRVVQSRDVSLHNFDGLAMSGLAFSVAPEEAVYFTYLARRSLTTDLYKFCHMRLSQGRNLFRGLDFVAGRILAIPMRLRPRR